MTSTAPSFEVQLLRKGRWETDSHHADAGVAEAAAKVLQNAGPHVDGVRITRELFDPNTARWATTVVFRRLYGESEELDAARDAKDAERRAALALKKSQMAGSATAPARRKSSRWKRNLPSLLLAAAAAVLALIGGAVWLHSR